MKLKTPITDTRELIELAFLVVDGAARAGRTAEDKAAAGKALALLIAAAEKVYGESGDADCHGADAPRNDTDGQKKRAVYPDIYDHSDKETLAGRLSDYAEWAACNEWETPLCLADDLRKASAFIRYVGEFYPVAVRAFEAEWAERTGEHGHETD